MTQDPGSFDGRLTRGPVAFDAARGREAAEGYGDLAPGLVDLVTGAGGSSPFLKGLLQRERDWAAPMLAASPEAARAGILADVAALEEGDLKPGLRLARRRLALLTALADLGGVWSLEEVTGALTAFADAAVDRTITALVGGLIRRGKIPAPKNGDGLRAGGMVAIAMGKMGAFELNYSSDIDLICLFDADLYARADYLDARAGFVRATRTMAQVLSDLTADGYVFRTDLRLRPDASVTPVCLPMEAAERYYESMGRTWERAAHIKARPAAGDVARGEAYLERIAPFVWRRHLDYAAIQDTQDMRMRIREHKGLSGKAGLPGYDMKLGPGGIREIEFFTQTRQLIAGGRDPELRLRDTVGALAKLAEKGWVEGEAAVTLTADYRAHREVEHRVQMVDDQQTARLPKDDEGFARIACLMGRTVEDLRGEIAQRLARVSDLTDDFFAPAQPRATAPELSETARAIVARWPSYPALRSRRAVDLFSRVRPALLARLSKVTNPDEALAHIDGFLAGLPAGVQLFALFDSNPQLVDLIVDIADVSPELARFLARNSGVFDAVIGGTFFEAWPGQAALAADLARRLAEIDDYERQLDFARIWRREWHFRVGVHLLRGLIDAETAGAQYADLAAAVLSALAGPVIAEFARKHGAPPGRGVAFLGLGSLGAGRLTATSDLDLIAIYDPQEVETSDGRRPLPARTYYARLTQAFVTAITAQLPEGRLYEVDMRLRPSGRQGPVATALSAFRTYQSEEAWTWEHLALTCARAIAGDGALGDEVEAVRTEILTRPHDRAKVLADVADMRRRLANAKPSQGPLDPKFGPGRLQDIALLAQAGALLAGSPARRVREQLRAGAGALGIDPAARETLTAAHRLFWQVQSAARLIGPGANTPETLGDGARRFLSATAGAEDLDDLTARMEHAGHAAAAILDAVLGSAAGPE
ncbi:bifunctional [glutamine synthetase] adenylyltransferase/[glutamine synthetase]-adenylyl-L-tyrosine phosphorylase [Palleronia sp. KMU-117]|uniref:bifunctional [glutamine synthetase] adenylyltransferase/[glutamine synthetase]-adenylyl-L-tyrosine phosphorylase n=1 Tax=Palleronia sp. KMU-117 TaxID=3434108 RepID=UPI003D74AD00